MKNKIPLYVKLLAKLLPLCQWEDSENLSDGEIRKFYFVENQRNKYTFGQQAVSSDADYDYIWRHISDDYFKCIAKSITRTC